MKRDMDLIRELMLRLEACQLGLGGVAIITSGDPLVAVPGKSEEEIYYHLNLIQQAGLIDAPGSQPMLGVTLAGLTWRGHDFVDSVRDPAIWRLTEEGARRAGGFSVDLLLALAKGLIKTKIEQHTGVKLDL